MATHDIFMPALSSTMTEGKIVEWLKNPGDKVGRGESVLVVESDKADMDVESFNEGYLAAVLMPAGSTAPVGETIGLIVETEAELAEAQAKAPSAGGSAPAATAPAASPPAATAPAPAPAAPTAPAPTAPSSAAAQPAPVAPPAPVAAPPSNGRLIASPRAKKLASQMGVDLAGIRGTGPNGRIQAEDVERAAGRPISVPLVGEGTAAAVSAGAESAANAPSSPAGNSFGRPGDTVPFNTLQGAVNRNMEASLAVPCFPGGLHDHH